MKGCMKLSTIRSLFLMALVVSFFFAGSVPPFLAAPPSSADYCGISLTELAAPPAHETVLELWASAPRQHCLRGYAPWLAAKAHPELGISVNVRAHNVNDDPFRDDLLAAAAQGRAPDLAFVYHYAIPPLVEQGYLVPLDECRQQAGLRQLADELWTVFSPDGQAWGVPFELETIVLNYNKAMLRQLGWSQPQIDQLPAQIASGEFTLANLLRVAQQAVSSGVIDAGLAFIPHPGQRHAIVDLHRAFGGRLIDPTSGQLVIDRAALQQTFAFLESLHTHRLIDPGFTLFSFSTWGNNTLIRDGMAHGRILFWQAYASDWQQMVMDYTDNEAEAAALYQAVGSALLPAGDANQAGSMLGVDLNQYVIFAEKATGRRHQQTACRLLAALHTTQLPQLHADKTSQLAVTSNGIALPTYWQTMGLQKVVWRPDRHPDFNPIYSRVLAEMATTVERGEQSAAAATAITLERLQAELGDQLLVE